MTKLSETLEGLGEDYHSQAPNGLACHLTSPPLPLSVFLDREGLVAAWV